MPTQIIKLSELPYKEKIDIGGHLYTFNGFEKRKIPNFGIQELFVFECDKPKHEKTFERFKFSPTKIKLKDGKYIW